MKNILVFIGVIVAFGYVCSGSYAASICDSVDLVGHREFVLGVENNYVFSRDIDETTSIIKGEILDSHQVYLKGTLGLSDFYDVCLKVGAANLKEDIKWTNGRRQRITYDYGLLVGVGGTWASEIDHNIGVVWDNQMIWWNTSADTITGDNNPYFNKRGSITNIELQSSLLLKYTHETKEDFKVVSYIGGAYSYYRSAKEDDTTYTDDTYGYSYEDRDGKDRIGAIVGMSCFFPKPENFILSLEGRFISEYAVTATGTYRF